MSKFHSMVSRRDFMKNLGLAGAGLGAAALTAPVFHDLDEMKSASSGIDADPWYVKQRNYLDMTTEVDWDVMKRYNGALNPMHGAHRAGLTTGSYVVSGPTPSAMGAYVGEEQGQKYDAQSAYNQLNPHPDVAGCDLRAFSAMNAGYHFHSIASKRTISGVVKASTGLGDEAFMNRLKTPAQLGVPKYTGTPEENALMMLTWSRYWGAFKVRCLPVDEKTKTFVNTNADRNSSAPGAAINFKDIDAPYITKDEYAIPNKFEYLLIPSFRSDYETDTRPYTNFYALSAFRSCQGEERYINQYIMAFMKGLGYQGMTQDSGSVGMFQLVPFGVASGHGELGRLEHCINTTNWHKNTIPIITDLPLPANNPIDAGINRFCRTCGKCAKACPGQALSHAKEPSWEDDRLTKPIVSTNLYYANPGKKTWWLDEVKCYKAGYVDNPGANSCGWCASVCVFHKLHDAGVHDLVKPVVSTTNLFNSFFHAMDVNFGYGPRPESEIDDFWKLGMNMPEYGRSS
ncbi:MAG: reductive dehalogenase [Dehalogenimonas sp.]